MEELGVGMVVCKVNEQRMWMGTTTELDCRTIADRKRVDSAIGCYCSCCDHVRGCSVLLCLYRDPVHICCYYGDLSHRHCQSEIGIDLSSPCRARLEKKHQCCVQVQV